MLKTKSIVKRIARLLVFLLSFSSFNLYASATEGEQSSTGESSSDGESGIDKGTNFLFDPNLPGKIFKIKNLASGKYMNVHNGFDDYKIDSTF